jgi:L-asparagine oxygenase
MFPRALDPVTTGRHPAPAVVSGGEWADAPDPIAVAGGPLDDRFVAAAGRAGRLLPPEVYDALIEFGDRGDHHGALIVRDVPTGQVPATPRTPDAATGKDRTSEYWLLAVARRLGQPVGYAPEHGGQVVQNVVPTAASADLQVSTSSKSALLFHTETAFHPHRPRYLLLLALRGDQRAGTTLSSVHELLPHLDTETVAILRQPRFRTAVDASFLAGRAATLTPPRAVIEGTLDDPTFVFDADLMVGADGESQAALDALNAVVGDHHATVVLEPGDLLIVDNHLAVHGRTPFTPRFDGTDRWLQRTFVVADLSPSAAERRGRVITTAF